MEQQKILVLTRVKMLLVEHIENSWHEIYEELGRWRWILAKAWNANNQPKNLSSP
jgi:hypothetical protein